MIDIIHSWSPVYVSVFCRFLPIYNLHKSELLFVFNLGTVLIKIFKKFGLNNNHSKICSDALINAELVGAYGHGLSRLKMYCDRIEKNVCYTQRTGLLTYQDDILKKIVDTAACKHEHLLVADTCWEVVVAE